LPTASRGEVANKDFAADGRPGPRDDWKKSIVFERAPSDVRKDGNQDLKVAPEQRPNLSAKECRARNLIRIAKESKVKREA
jgi:hypothetical protein